MRVNCILLDRYLRIRTESYPDWYWLWSSWWTLCSRLSCILLDRYLRIQTESYPDWYWLWYMWWTLSCTWIGIDLRVFIGVGHLLHPFTTVSLKPLSDQSVKSCSIHALVSFAKKQHLKLIIFRNYKHKISNSYLIRQSF